MTAYMEVRIKRLLHISHGSYVDFDPPIVFIGDIVDGSLTGVEITITTETDNYCLYNRLRSFGEWNIDGVLCVVQQPTRNPPHRDRCSRR